MTHNDDKQPHSVGRELASGVFYTSVAKYAGGRGDDPRDGGARAPVHPRGVRRGEHRHGDHRLLRHLQRPGHRPGRDPAPEPLAPRPGRHLLAHALVGSRHRPALLRRLGADRLVLRRLGATARHLPHPRAEPLLRHGEHRPQRAGDARQAFPLRRRALAGRAGRRRCRGHRRGLRRGRHLRPDDQPRLFRA